MVPEAQRVWCYQAAPTWKSGQEKKGSYPAPLELLCLGLRISAVTVASLTSRQRRGQRQNGLACKERADRC